MGRRLNIENAIFKAIEDKKGLDTRLYKVKDKNPLCDFVFVTTVLNEKQMNAIISGCEEVFAKYNITIKNIEGKDCSSWKIIDAHDIIIHIFTGEARNRYSIENQFR